MPDPQTLTRVIDDCEDKFVINPDSFIQCRPYIEKHDPVYYIFTKLNDYILRVFVVEFVTIYNGRYLCRRDFPQEFIKDLNELEIGKEYTYKSNEPYYIKAGKKRLSEDLVRLSAVIYNSPAPSCDPKQFNVDEVIQCLT